MTTIDLQVVSGADDAHENDNNGNFAHDTITVRCDAATGGASRFNGGMRFPNATVPNSATIDTAYISAVFPSTQRDSPDLDILAEDVDDADDFSTTQAVTARTRTSASANWSGTDLGTGSFVNSPDISTVIQEVIDRAGWVSGNAIVIFADGENTTPPELGCRFTSYDQSTTDATKLHIEYTAVTGKTRPTRPISGRIPIHQLQL